MDNDKYINDIMYRVKTCRLPRVPDEDNNFIKGEHGIMGFLSCKDNVSAGELSDYLNVSTARIAAALNNLEQKGYIIRRNDTIDKRRVIVSLTSKGVEHNRVCDEKFHKKIGLIIDEIGREKFEEFLQTSKRIREIIERNDNKC